jgi:pimeloyl-ACP methyl ester carboxylesterase
MRSSDPSLHRRPAGPAPIRFAGPDGFELAMHDLGGTGPIMLMAHATGLHGWVYRRLAAHLGHRFHCWALDLRGHGDSPVDEGSSLEWSVFGRDVLAALDHLDAKKVVGFGHSLGGPALLMAADQRPDAFERLVLYEPAIVRPWESAPPRLKENQSFMVEVARRRRNTFASRAEALLNYAAKEPMSDFNAGALFDYVAHGFGDRGDLSVELKCRPEVEAQVFASTFTQQSWAILERLPCAVHILRGSDTDEIHRSTAADMYRDFGLSQLEIEGLGHFGPLQNPAQLAAEVLRAIGAEGGA